jgi:phospholipase/lecithinase/hemolysin
MVAIPRLTQDAFRNRFPTSVCEPPFDVNDVLFWDLLHPTTAAHDVIAMFAFGAVSGMR